MVFKATPKKTKIFISYKTGEKDGMTFAANTIKKALDAADYDVWMDQDSLKAGANWNDQIYDQIRTSDVLVLILGTTTMNSDWVRREIDVAKGSGVTILPVLVRDDFDKQIALDKFDIPRVQYVDLLTGDDGQFQNLLDQIKELKGQTLKRQKEWVDKRLQDEKGTQFSVVNQNLEYYMLQNPDNNAHPLYKNLVLHIAAGNMAEMSDIDIYVNSENDYMQMARIFESKTVSALLRYHGSQIDRAGRLVDDTVQQELDFRICADPELQKRPFGVGTVIVTHAGHPESDLVRKNHARYIFHTAAVSVEDGDRGKYLQPILQDSGLKRCVKNTLDKALELNEKKGNTWPKEAKEWQGDQDKTTDYQPVTSIVIPMFGSGHGGREAKEVIPPIVHGLYEFLVDMIEMPTDHFTLTDIYLCVYYQEDVEPMRDALKKNFREISEAEYLALKSQKPAVANPVLDINIVSGEEVKKVAEMRPSEEQIQIVRTEAPPENAKPKMKEKKAQSNAS